MARNSLGTSTRDCIEEMNRKACNCSYEPCSRKGFCCDCLRYHWRKGQFPACFFPEDVERSYDRSVERFIEAYNQRGRWW